MRWSSSSNDPPQLVGQSLSSLLLSGHRASLLVLLSGHRCPYFSIYQLIVPAPGKHRSFSGGETGEISSCAFRIISKLYCHLRRASTYTLSAQSHRLRSALPHLQESKSSSCYHISATYHQSPHRNIVSLHHRIITSSLKIDVFSYHYRSSSAKRAHFALTWSATHQTAQYRLITNPEIPLYLAWVKIVYLSKIPILSSESTPFPKQISYVSPCMNIVILPRSTQDHQWASLPIY